MSDPITSELLAEVKGKSLAEWIQWAQELLAKVDWPAVVAAAQKVIADGTRFLADGKLTFGEAVALIGDIVSLLAAVRKAEANA